MRRSSGSRRRREWRCLYLDSSIRVSDRQERVPGWNQQRLSAARILIAGAGGIGCLVAEALTRQGAGEIHIVDPGIVDPPDLNRQLYARRSLYKAKAVELARALGSRGQLGTLLVAHTTEIQNLDLEQLRPDAIVIAVDQRVPRTRAWVSQQCRQRRTPAVFTAVTPDAQNGYVFIQTPGGPCLGCAVKFEANPTGDAAQCPGAAAASDVLMVAAGLATFAVSAVLMGRARDWNHRYFSLRDSEHGGGTLVKPHPDCQLCRGKGA